MSSVTLPFVDYAKYAGRWYTVAKIPFEYDKNCECTYADYTFTGKHLCVVNTCVLADGTSYTRKGTAVAGNAVEPGKLMISFDDKMQHYGNVKVGQAGDYYLHYTDYTRYAVVGSPSGNYLWILARQANCPPLEDLQKLKAFVVDLGYDEKKILFEKRIRFSS
jgi:apolipoprotein D and lipocalin family protein